MLRRCTVITALILAVAAFWGAPVSAHPALEVRAELPAAPTAAPTATWSAAPTPPTIPWPALLAVALVSIAAWRRPRRALALAIVVILAVFAFENGVHSVHHLNSVHHSDDLRAGATCTVAAATAQLAGTPVDGAVETQFIPAAPERLVLQQQLSFDASALAVHQGRAPPVSA